MEYQYIVNPMTNRRCRIDGALGRRIIKNYVQCGGSTLGKVEYKDKNGNKVVAKWIGDKNGKWVRLEPEHCNPSDISIYRRLTKSSYSKKLKIMSNRYIDFCNTNSSK